MQSPVPSRSPSGPGGYLPPDTGLLSPSPSMASSTTTAQGFNSLNSLSNQNSHGSSPWSALPHPRRNPLRPGSSKEDMVRRFVEARMMHIQRRFVKKFGIAEPDDEVVGYRSMSELCRDVDNMLNALWLSGTPSLQIPYLLNLACELVGWISGFPVATSARAQRAIFALLRKLDHCFASLLAGTDIETGDALPGITVAAGRGGMTRTDMVRCRSTAELTRVAVVEAMTRRHRQAEEEENDNDDDNQDDTYDEEMYMDVAAVYERTLMKLGEVMGDGGGKIGETILFTDDDDDI